MVAVSCSFRKSFDFYCFARYFELFRCRSSAWFLVIVTQDWEKKIFLGQGVWVFMIGDVSVRI